MLLHRRYDITVVFYYHLIPSCFFTFSPSLLFYILKIFSLLVSFVFLWNLQFHIRSMFYLYLQCTLRYSLDSTIAGSKIRLIMCSIDYVMQNHSEQTC